MLYMRGRFCITVMAILGGDKVKEMERVTRRGGLILVATAAPGDVSQVEAEPLGDFVYRSTVAGQEGCVLTIPEREALQQFFPGRQARDR